MIRAVVTTKYGCQERTGWYPNGSPEAEAAMKALAHRQTTEFSVTWESWDKASRGRIFNDLPSDKKPLPEA